MQVLIVALLLLALLMANGTKRPVLRVAMLRGIEGQQLREAIESFKQTRGTDFSITSFEYQELMLHAHEDRLDGPFDVMLVDDPWIYSLAQARRLRVFEQLDEDFIESCRRAAQAPCPDKPGDLCYYGIPYVGNSQILCYRPKLTGGRAIQNWDDIMAMKVPSERRKAYRYAMRVERTHPIVSDFLPLLWAYSPASLKPLPKDECEVKLEDRSEEAICKMIELGRIGPVAGMSYQDFDVASMLARRNVAAAVIWSAYAMQMKFALETSERSPEELRFAQVPAGPSGSYAELGIWLLAVPQNSPHAALAREFVLDASNPANMIKAARLGNPPTRASTFAYNDLQNDFPSLNEQRISLVHGWLRPRIKEWPEVDRKLAEHLARLVMQYSSALPPHTSCPDLVKRSIPAINRDIVPARCRSGANATGAGQ